MAEARDTPQGPDPSASENRRFEKRAGQYDEGRYHRRRVEWMRQYLDVTDSCELRRRCDDFARRRARLRQLDRTSVDRTPDLGKRGLALVGEGGEDAKLSHTRRPTGEATWGETGRYVRVNAPGGFAPSLLAFRLDPESVDHLEPALVYVARWDEGGERFRLLPQSGYNADEGYAYARITRGGIYTTMGLPRDPRIQTTLRLFRAVRGWTDARPGLRKNFVDPICTVILCADWMQEVMGDERLLDEMGLDPRDFPGGFGGGDICEQCLGGGIGPGGSPEEDLVDLLDRPTLVDPVIVFDPVIVWPRPCKTWHNRGPRNVSGRTGVLAVHPDDGDIVYAGATAGGVWRTADGGSTWTARMHEELSLAIGGLGLAASNPDVLYAATGEWTSGIGAPIDPVTRGVGVYRTSDGGLDWDLCAPIASEMCAAVAVDPTDPDRVFVAGERALHRSTDGGATWDVGAGMTDGLRDGETSDVVVDPDDPDRVYIGVHRDGVYRSINGGGAWERLDSGIDTGAVADAPKIALGRDGDHGTSFVAVKMGDRIYTSTDGGDGFERKTNTTDGIGFFAWCNMIAVDPVDEDVLFAGGSNLYRSTDGGDSWAQVGGYGTNVHADMQCVVFDPDDHDHVYVANDGGVWASDDNGENWDFASRGLVGTHIYVGGVSDTPTLRYGGSIQDDDGFHFTGAADWESLRAGEGGYVEYDPTDHEVIYHDGWFSQLRKSTDGGATWNDLGLNTDTNYAEPLAISRQDSDRLLAIRTDDTIQRSTDGGTTWNQALDPGTGVSAIRYAPSDDRHAYVGSRFGGRVWHSDDRGATWDELDTAALPNARIQSIVADWSDPRRLWVAFAGTGIRHLWRGELDAAGDATWFDASGVLPAVSLPDLPLTGLAVHPTLEETVFVSTLLGVLRSVDGGDSWETFDEGLPNAFVSDLDLRERDRSLWASTMGRGLYRRFL